MNNQTTGTALRGGHSLHQKVAAASNPADRQMYQRQIEMTVRAIDRLVYGLYGFSEDEIRMVEG
jgi:hypothetical protein